MADRPKILGVVAPYLGTTENPCKWVTSSDGKQHTITIPGYEFMDGIRGTPLFKVSVDSNGNNIFVDNRNNIQSGLRATLTSIENQINASAHTITLLSKDGNPNNPSYVNNAPDIWDVRHLGAHNIEYRECGPHGEYISNAKIGADLYSDKTVFRGVDPYIRNDVYALYYNNSLNHTDTTDYVWKEESIKTINPNGRDDTEEILFHNYDNRSNVIRIKWNIETTRTPADIPCTNGEYDPNSGTKVKGGETIYDVFAVRARFSIDDGKTWSTWFCNFASGDTGEWDIGPTTMLLFGDNPNSIIDGRKLADESNNWWGFGSESKMNKLYSEDIVTINGKSYRNRIPPGWPFNIKVQVQVANFCGIGSAENITCNGIHRGYRHIKIPSSNSNGYTMTVENINGINTDYRTRFDARRIYVKQAIDNAFLVNVKPYMDWLCVNFQGPAGTVNNNDVNPDFLTNDTSKKHSPINTVYRIIVYAKGGSLNEYKKVYHWQATPKDNDNTPGQNYNRKIGSSVKTENPKAIFNHLRKDKLCLAKQNELIPDVNIKNGVCEMDETNAKKEHGINKKIFEPDTVYTLKVYYTVALNDTNNDWYLQYYDTQGNHYDENGFGWQQHIKTITKCKQFKVRTLPLPKIHLNYLQNGETLLYKYIFGNSELINSTTGKPNPMRFRLERPVGLIDVENTMNPNAPITFATSLNKTNNVFTNEYDQITSLRFTLYRTKGSKTVKISRIINPVEIPSGHTNPNDGSSFSKEYYLNYKGITLPIYLSLSEWDSLYRLFENNKSPNPNQLECSIKLEAKSSYIKRKSDGSPIYLDNNGNETDTITSKFAYYWYTATLNNIPLFITLTGIHPTTHVNNKLIELSGDSVKSPHRRAYVWINNTNGTVTGKQMKRAVVWINPTNGDLDIPFRCI